MPQAAVTARLPLLLRDPPVSSITVDECGFTHLAYASEIAGAMLRRQQAQAVVAARKTLVEGAVGMVEMALDMLSAKKIVELDVDQLL